MYRYILFDLDGTLTDSKEGIFKSLRSAFQKMGRPVPPDEILRCFIGPPLQDSFALHCGFDEEQIQTAIRLFKDRYEDVGKFENIPAPGMLQLCRRLKEQGYVLALASSKPEVTCREICEKFGFAPYFSVITGSPDEVDWDKAHVIRVTLSRLGLSPAEKDRCLMVGDRDMDVLGAKACGLACVGMEFFGYAAPGELEKAGAAAVCSSAQELEAFLSEH